MTPYYSENTRFLVAVDCIIFGFDYKQLKLLLIKRNFQPQKGKWSLVGGFLEADETLDQSALRILNNLTGLNDIYLEQLYTYGEIKRDPGERVLSTAYYALINAENYHLPINRESSAKWFPIEKTPPLVFDHNIMVDKAMRRLKRKSLSQPIGFELLPEKFTIPQLQKLYEVIHQRELDKRNFRKKILSMGLLKKLDEKQKSDSRKGAFYYRFDKEKYDDLVSRGFHFEI
ncbi:MAG: NUDIX hydrolase [Bacteroidales bacterium]|nr:NUDIX hydrolase [Bacteroidales bacterium]